MLAAALEDIALVERVVGARALLLVCRVHVCVSCKRVMDAVRARSWLLRIA
jgi:hypothetical protein